MREIRNHLYIILICLFAMSLQVLPLPNFAQYLRPEWLILVLIYWFIALPDRVNFAYAFIFGVLLDGLYGSVLGSHALPLVILAYICVRFHRQIRVFPLWQQAFFVFALILLYHLIEALVVAMLGFHQSLNLFFLPALVSMFLWPWIFIILRDCRRRLKID